MRKYVNFRLPVLIALLLALGIVAGYCFFFFHISALYLIAVVPVAAIFFIIFTVKSQRKSYRVYTLLFSAIFIIGAVNCYLRLLSYSQSGVQEDYYYSVSGRVVEIVNTDYAVLDNLEFNGKGEGGKLILYFTENKGDNFEAGYTVSFNAKVQILETFYEGRLNYYAEQNVKFRAVTNEIVSSKYGTLFLGSIKNTVRQTLFDNLDNDTAAVCYAMLTGDTTEMDEGTLNNFRYGGIAHIFAVSGLHIGIIYGIIAFLTRGLNKYAAAAINCGVLILYAGVCAFTLSSIRALIMCGVNMLCRLAKKKYDGLNSLAFAAFTILLITPLSLYAAGFQLSVCAVGGILILSRPLNKKLERIKKAAQPISISLSAQAGTAPVLLAQFGYLSGAGILLNVVVVPLISVLFVPLFIGVLLSIIVPIIAPFVVYYCALPISAVISFLINLGFERTLISGLAAGAFVPLYFLCLFFLSDKINLKKHERLACASVSLLTLITCSLATM